MARASAAPAPLDALAARFRQRVARARRQLGVAVVFFGLVAAALLARQGTGVTRLVGAGSLLLAFFALGFAVIHTRRTLSSQRRLIAATLSRAQPALGARALRALSLVERSAAQPG